MKVGLANYAQGPGRRTQPHISLVADVEILCPTDPAGLVRAIRADAEHIGRLSAATIERFACDAGITRVITKGRSEPLDVGRATRVISPRCGRRSSCATAAASNPDVIAHPDGVRSTTENHGHAADRPTSRTANSAAGNTTATNTKAADARPEPFPSTLGFWLPCSRRGVPTPEHS